MRTLRFLLMLTSLTGAWSCAEREGGPTPCEVGPEIHQDAIAELTSGPACRSDAECVRVDTAIDCPGISISLCGDVMHRESAARWDAEAVCERIAEASRPTRDGCGLQAGCIASRPACVAGACTAVGD